jgi:hypothetical protein
MMKKIKIIFKYNIIGAKPALIKKLKDFDVEFVTTIFKNLNPVYERFTRNKLKSTFSTEEMGNEVISRINNISVTRNSIQCLNIAKPITKELMNIGLELFRKRDSRICDSHKEINSGRNNYEQYKASAFCSPDFYDMLQQNPNRTDIRIQENNIDLNSLFCIYIPILLNNQNQPFSDSWYLLIIDVVNKKVFYFNPRVDVRIQVDAFNLNKMQEMRAVISPFLERFITLHHGIWDIDYLQNAYFAPLQNDFDAGLYILNIIYFHASFCPVYFDEHDITKFRLQYCYWILNDTLPI